MPRHAVIDISYCFLLKLSMIITLFQKLLTIVNLSSEKQSQLYTLIVNLYLIFIFLFCYTILATDDFMH